MRTGKAPRYGLRPAAHFACAAALCFATSAVAQIPSPKRDAPPASPTSGAVVSYQEARSAGIVYHEEKGGLVSSVAPPVRPAGAPPPPVATAKVAPAAIASAPQAPAAAARKSSPTPSKVAQGPAPPDRARP